MLPKPSKAAFLWSIIGLNLALLAKRLITGERPPPDGIQGDIEELEDKFSYIGPDFPTTLPIHISTVAMTFQPSIHYRINTSLALQETQDATPHEKSTNPSDTGIPDEWLSTYTSDLTRSGTYFIRIGPSHRTFMVGLIHQLHCLSTIQKSFLYPNYALFGEHHIGHCLNYLRQLFLCEADDTLEPGDFVEEILAGKGDEGPIFERECRDWETVLDFNRDNLIKFRHYRDYERDMD